MFRLAITLAGSAASPTRQNYGSEELFGVICLALDRGSAIYSSHSHVGLSLRRAHSGIAQWRACSSTPSSGFLASLWGLGDRSIVYHTSLPDTHPQLFFLGFCIDILWVHGGWPCSGVSRETSLAIFSEMSGLIVKTRHVVSTPRVLSPMVFKQRY